MASPVDKFFLKYNDVGIDDDGAYGNQCMDVYARYQREVFGGVQGAEFAKLVPNSYNKNYFTLVKNSPSYVPKKGEVAVFTWGTFGHIAIVAGGCTTNKLVTFGQNYPTEGYYDNHGNFIGTGKCHLQEIPYQADMYFLVPKKDVNFDQEAYDAAQAALKAAADAKAKAEAEKKAAEEAAKKAEADRIAKEEAAKVAAEQKKLAEEQARLEAEQLAKVEADKKAEEARLAKEKEENDKLAAEQESKAQNGYTQTTGYTFESFVKALKAFWETIVNLWKK